MSKQQSKVEIVDYFRRLEALTADTRRKIAKLDEKDGNFPINLSAVIFEFNNSCKKLGGQ